MNRLRAAAQALGQRHPEIEEIRLFGSLARGDAVPGSDADVLVLLSQVDRPFLERALVYALPNCGIGVDVLVYSREEFARMAQDRARFYRAVTEEGVELYRRP